MVYVEGECSMNKFTGKDGSAQSGLSIVQRMCERSLFSPHRWMMMGQWVGWVGLIWRKL